MHRFSMSGGTRNRTGDTATVTSRALRSRSLQARSGQAEVRGETWRRTSTTTCGCPIRSGSSGRRGGWYLAWANALWAPERPLGRYRVAIREHLALKARPLRGVASHQLRKDGDYPVAQRAGEGTPLGIRVELLEGGWARSYATSDATRASACTSSTPTPGAAT